MFSQPQHSVVQSGQRREKLLGLHNTGYWPHNAQHWPHAVSYKVVLQEAAASLGV